MISEKLRQKLADPEYRAGFVASLLNIQIPFQVRALLKSRAWTQEMLAKRTNMLQPRISGIVTPGKTRPNIETLRRIAEAFDCGLLVKFVPFSELAKWSEDFDPENFTVPAFENDTGFIDKKPAASVVSIPDGAYRFSEFTGIEGRRGERLTPDSTAVGKVNLAAVALPGTVALLGTERRWNVTG